MRTLLVLILLFAIAVNIGVSKKKKSTENEDESETSNKSPKTEGGTKTSNKSLKSPKSPKTEGGTKTSDKSPKSAKSPKTEGGTKTSNKSPKSPKTEGGTKTSDKSPKSPKSPKTEATAQKTTCKEIRCFSHGHRYETCYLPDITIVDVRVKKLHSKHAGCVRAYGQPQTDYNEKNKGIWGVSDENFIWVAGGCKADFEYCYQVCECSASGDPHFELFDGQKMSYQGICKYLFAEAHSGDCFISVDVMTAQSIRHPNAAYVEAIYVTIGEANESVSIGQNKEIKVNDVLETAPYTGDGYTISEAGDFIVVENICDMKAMHNGKNKAKVIINKEDGISFTGVCGNCNGVPDDLRLKNGTDVSHEAHRAIMIGNSYAYQPETCGVSVPSE